MKAMAFMPEDRYQTARALADDIERWTAGQPVTAWDEPLPRRLRRWTRRAAPAVTLVMLPGLVGLAVVAGMQSAQIAGSDWRALPSIQALNDSRESTNQANVALGESQEWRKRAEAVGTFLTGAFRRSGPREDGRELKAANLLDRAAGDLAKDRDPEPHSRRRSTGPWERPIWASASLRRPNRCCRRRTRA